MKSRFLVACRLALFCLAANTAMAQSTLPPPLQQQIVANLLFQYPQFAAANPVVDALGLPDADGMRLGTLRFDKGRTQPFALSERGTVYLLQGKPFVLLDAAQIETAKATREQEKAREDAERLKQLEKAIAGLPQRGNPKAGITLVEFSDYQCPYCARAAKAIDEMLATSGKEVRYVVMPFPLDTIHPWARGAAIASQCAMQQNAPAFWKLNDAYYAQQGEFNKDNTLPKSRELLAGEKIDLKRWDACVGDPNSKDYARALAAVDASVALGRSIGVNATPSFFVNGRKFSGMPSVQAFTNLLAKPAAAGAAVAPKP